MSQPLGTLLIIDPVKEQFFEPWLPEAFYLYSEYKTGLLPGAGGLNDQTPAYLSIMRHLSRLSNQYEQDQMDEQKRKLKGIK